MNLLKSFIVGNIISWIPTIILTFLNYKYDDEIMHRNIFGIYSFYLFDLLILILFYILNHQKNKNINKNLIILCFLSFIITYFSIFISYFTTKIFISEKNKEILSELKGKEFENIKNTLNEDKNIDFIEFFFENIFGKIVIYHISLYFYSYNCKL